MSSARQEVDDVFGQILMDRINGDVLSGGEDDWMRQICRGASKIDCNSSRNSKEESNGKGEADEEEANNDSEMVETFEIAWEWLEVAKKIYQASKDHSQELSEVLSTLGELSLEIGRWGRCRTRRRALSCMSQNNPKRQDKTLKQLLHSKSSALGRMIAEFLERTLLLCYVPHTSTFVRFCSLYYIGVACLNSNKLEDAQEHLQSALKACQRIVANPSLLDDPQDVDEIKDVIKEIQLKVSPDLRLITAFKPDN